MRFFYVLKRGGLSGGLWREDELRILKAQYPVIGTEVIINSLLYFFSMGVKLVQNEYAYYANKSTEYHIKNALTCDYY